MSKITHTVSTTSLSFAGMS